MKTSVNLEINQLKISNLNNINIKYSEIYVIEVLWERRTGMGQKIIRNILQPQTHKSEEKASNYRCTYLRKKSYHCKLWISKDKIK